MKAAQACRRVSLHGSDRFTILQINRWEDCISEILCGPNCDVVGVGEGGIGRMWNQYHEARKPNAPVWMDEVLLQHRPIDVSLPVISLLIITLAIRQFCYITRLYWRGRTDNIKMTPLFLWTGYRRLEYISITEMCCMLNQMLLEADN